MMSGGQPIARSEATDRKRVKLEDLEDVDADELLLLAKKKQLLSAINRIHERWESFTLVSATQRQIDLVTHLISIASGWDRPSSP